MRKAADWATKGDWHTGTKPQKDDGWALCLAGCDAMRCAVLQICLFGFVCNSSEWTEEEVLILNHM